MADTNTESLRISRLILIPSIITLAVTVLRLVGELQGWSKVFFNPEPGGPGAIVGIAWLAPIFGVYFALKLSGAGQGPTSVGRLILYAILGLVIVVAGGFVGFGLQPGFPGQLIVGLLLLAAGTAIPFFAWRSLWKTLIAYGYAARIPVAILMFFAIRGQWGTHYDVLPPGFPPETGFWATYMSIAFLPQMVLWIAYTVLTGALFGGIATAIVHRRRPATQAAGV